MKFTILQSLEIEKVKFEELSNQLKEKGYQINIVDSIGKSKEELIKELKDTEILMVTNMELRKNIIQTLPNLKMISIAFTAFNQIDTEYCKENGIVVCNAAGYSTNSVAELTIGLIISLYRKIKESDNITREGGTRAGLLGSELFGKTVGIIGTGDIGLRVAEIVKAFDCNILGYSRTEKEEAKELGIKYTSLNELLEKSDIVTVHTPLNTQTENLLNKENIRLMKSSGLLINTARGQVIESEALYESLKNKKIAGAGLDVFDIEPPLDRGNPLFELDNVLLTPHTAFYTKEALYLRADIAFDNIYKWLDGSPQNVVN